MSHRSNFFCLDFDSEKKWNKRCRGEKLICLLKTVVKYKHYVIETGNVYQCCSVSNSTDNTKNPFWSIKAIVCLMLKATVMLSMWWEMDIGSFLFLFLTPWNILHVTLKLWQCVYDYTPHTANGLAICMVQQWFQTDFDSSWNVTRDKTKMLQKKKPQKVC